LEANGDSPGAVEQADLSTQERRMKQLLGVADLKDAKILDFGCGTGHLLKVLRESGGFSGEYHGYDITPGLIELASKKFPDARFEVRNIFEEGIAESFDFVL